MKKDNVFYINKISNGYVLKTKEEYHSYISKLYNKDLFTFLSRRLKETWDNIDQVIPVSHKINFNEDIL